MRLVRDLSRACGSYEPEARSHEAGADCGREGAAGRGGEAVVADLQVVVCNRVEERERKGPHPGGTSRMWMWMWT